MKTKEIILQEVKHLIQFPDSHVCKHYAAIGFLNVLSKLGYKVSEDLAAAVVDADDVKILSLLS